MTCPLGQLEKDFCMPVIIFALPWVGTLFLINQCFVKVCRSTGYISYVTLTQDILMLHGPMFIQLLLSN